MTAQEPAIVLTGFGAFPGVDRNATAELVPELVVAARARFPDYRVIGEVLPVEWSRAPQALAQILRGAEPVLALHFGVSHRAHGLQLEMVGRNVRAMQPDACGEVPGEECVLHGGPATIAATLPSERILARLGQRGIACCASNDAGGYLCNALLYHSLTAAGASANPFLSGFVHVPSDLARDAAVSAPRGLPWGDAIAGSVEIIAACLEALPSAAAVKIR